MFYTSSFQYDLSSIVWIDGKLIRRVTHMHAGNDQLAEFWMPFTANKAYKSHPRMLVSAEGMYYQSADGRTLLDGTAGLWCTNAGHCRKEIAEAIAKSARELDFAPTFQLGHPAPFALANRLAKLMPNGLDRIFFTNSGSEAVDTALKIALSVQKARGQHGRFRLIGRDRAYHGVGFGGISVGGIVTNRRAFGAGVAGADHLRHTHDLKRNRFSRGLPEHGAELADDLQRLVDLHGAETIAAVIVEPMAGSTGVLLPPKGYLQRLRNICDTHGILLIFDEVITGFGRVGSATAAEQWGVTPDIITMAKGLTNAAVPMGAVAVKRELHDDVMEGVTHGIELFHGYTYSGHPLACAAAIATLDIYAREGLFDRTNRMAERWENAAHSLADAPHVIDIRSYGLVVGVELKGRDGAIGARATEVFQHCFDNGLLVRATGDVLALSPPLIVDEAQIDEMFGMLRQALEKVA
jgi:beta-alanine--pyruvate transaminase